MKVKNRVIIESIPALNRLSDVSLPGRVAFVVAKNLRVLSSVLERLEAEKDEITGKWLERDESGNPVPVVCERGVFRLRENNKLSEELEAFLDSESDVNISFIGREGLESAEVKPGDLASIAWMVRENRKA